MKKIYPSQDIHPYRTGYIYNHIKGQCIVNKGWTCYVEVKGDWYDMEKPADNIHFPVTLKEDNIKRILERVDEI